MCILHIDAPPKSGADRRKSQMAIATETNNRVQDTVEESARANLRAYDTLTDYYLSALDAGLKLQARAIETTKLLLDESVSFQRSNRALAEELLQSMRKAEQVVRETAESNLRSIQNPWFGATRR
jgi:hypothetical protein